MSAVLSYSYQDQLAFIESNVREVQKMVAMNMITPAIGATQQRMWLSLSRSIKTASDHDMNCPLPSIGVER